MTTKGDGEDSGSRSRIVLYYRVSRQREPNEKLPREIAYEAENGQKEKYSVKIPEVYPKANRDKDPPLIFFSNLRKSIGVHGVDTTFYLVPSSYKTIPLRVGRPPDIR